jgi:hypothetical protein
MFSSLPKTHQGDSIPSIWGLASPNTIEECPLFTWKLGNKD